MLSPPGKPNWSICFSLRRKCLLNPETHGRRDEIFVQFRFTCLKEQLIDLGNGDGARPGKTTVYARSLNMDDVMKFRVELPYISCKNLAEVVHIRHYLQESCKNLGFQTNLSDSCRSDISCRFRRFLQDSCRSRHFLQDSWTDLARQCLKLERYSARKCLECTGNVNAIFQF